MRKSDALQSAQVRREILLSLINPDGFGLEVGPSYNPLMPKSKGYNVEVVDYADTAGLREKYKRHPHIDLNKIEHVDYVSDGRSLLELIGEPERYDYIVASHVIEHVTDVVRFLQDCESLLKPNGVLLLVVPDKRFCFDALRPVSTVGEALQAYCENRSRHTPGQVFDFIHSFAKKSGEGIWADTTLDGMELVNSPEQALNFFQSAQTSTQYIDIHAWRFTPSYFRYLIKTLRSLGFIKSGEENIITNDDSPVYRFEFYVALSKSAPTSIIPDIELLRAAEMELFEIEPVRRPASHQELNRLKLELASLRASTSWKVTAPLRYIRTLIG